MKSKKPRFVVSLILAASLKRSAAVPCNVGIDLAVYAIANHSLEQKNDIYLKRLNFRLLFICF